MANKLFKANELLRIRNEESNKADGYHNKGFVDFTQNTTLHGIKSVTDKNIPFYSSIYMGDSYDSASRIRIIFDICIFSEICNL